MAPTSPHVSRTADRSPAERVRLPTLLLVAGVLLAAVAVWVPAAEQRASSERTYELTRSGQLMLTAMLDQETGVRGYLLTAASSSRTAAVAPRSTAPSAKCCARPAATARSRASSRSPPGSRPTGST